MVRSPGGVEEKTRRAEETNEANGEKEEYAVGQWRRGVGALKFGFRVHGPDCKVKCIGGEGYWGIGF
jgi:hypothetical protein